MTPQLQQAIRLLQLSSMELSVEIQQALDSNMMLELEDDVDDEIVDYANDLSVTAPTPTEHEHDDDGIDGDDIDNYVASTTEDISEDLPVDSNWDEIVDSNIPASGTGPNNDDNGGDFESVRGNQESLRDHLLWQLNLLPLTDVDRTIATAIIDALNDDGYLETSLEEIKEVLNLGGVLNVELDEIQAMLKQIQALEPAGVAARDLKECLQIQLRQLDPATPWVTEAIRICDGFLEALGARDYNQILRRLKLSQDDLREIIGLIQAMNPRPGSCYNEAPPEYLVPDVFVRKHKGRWKVELNADAMPHVRVNPFYAAMIRRADNSPDNHSLKTHLQEAKWFIKSLQSRSETLLRVAGAIVEQQRGFLEHGEEAMKPLVLHDIAETLGMHESTISRVTTRKYMHTPRGIYELKYFFSSHVGTSMGGEASSTAIRAVIKKLIASESIQKPLSDSKIATILSKQGINVARRTVAKYRESMQIPPSNERKRLV